MGQVNSGAPGRTPWRVNGRNVIVNFAIDFLYTVLDPRIRERRT